LRVKPAKAMTIRLSAEQAEELETVAAVDNQPISEVIRAAIAEHVAGRKSDSHFQDGLRERIERAQRMLGGPKQ
jgi:predicted transcriptional regulator